MFLHTLWISFCFFVKWILLMYSYVYIDYWTSFLSSVNISRLRSDKRDWKLHKDVMKWTSCWFLSCNLVIKCQLFFDIVIILPDILVDVYSENGAVLMWGFSLSLRLQSVCVLASGSLKRQRIRQSAPVPEERSYGQFWGGISVRSQSSERNIIVKLKDIYCCWLDLI